MRPPQIERRVLHLSMSSQEALASTLGKRLTMAFAPSLNVSKEWIFAPVLSLAVDERFVVFTADAQETPGSWITFHSLAATLADEPERVPRTEVGGLVVAIRAGASSIDVASPEPISEVWIFAREESSKLEQVTYDFALVFQARSGPILGIRSPSMTVNGVEVTTCKHAIEELVAESATRDILRRASSTT